MYDSVADVMAAYEQGEREFAAVRIDDADFRDRALGGARFVNCDLYRARFDGTGLGNLRFTGCDLAEASFAGAFLYDVRIAGSDLSGARMERARLLNTSLADTGLPRAGLTGARVLDSHLVSVDLDGARLDGLTLGFTTFVDLGLGPFCDARGLVHEGPVYLDFRSVLRSYRHAGLKQFLVDCGVPPTLAEYTIDAARAEGEGALESLMRSTFISYGAPDEAFARRLYEALREKHVTTFFFPETATFGRRISNEVHDRIQEHDRVIVVCSRNSLDRPGVRNEIQATFDREAREGGAEYLLPIALDDYLLSEWDDPLAQRVRDRVVADFSDERQFDRQVGRLLAALRKQPG